MQLKFRIVSLGLKSSQILALAVLFDDMVKVD